MPDPQLESQASTCGWNQTSTEAISSVFVWNPETKYGTRFVSLFTLKFYFRMIVKLALSVKYKWKMVVFVLSSFSAILYCILLEEDSINLIYGL